MLQTLRKIVRPSKSDSLARAFSRLGWIGFWIQVAIGAIPLALITYAFVFGRDAGAGTRGGFALVRYLAVAGLLVLAFTTLWSLWYTRIANASPMQRDARRNTPCARCIDRRGGKRLGHRVVDAGDVVRDRAAPDLFPPCAASRNTVIQTTAGGQASWISAADIVHLLALGSYHVR